jgi:hypothetical protein
MMCVCQSEFKVLIINEWHPNHVEPLQRAQFGNEALVDLRLEKLVVQLAVCSSYPHNLYTESEQDASDNFQEAMKILVLKFQSDGAA